MAIAREDDQDDRGARELARGVETAEGARKCVGDRVLRDERDGHGLDPEAARPGDDVSEPVCQAWEQTANGAESCRVVLLRLGIVLDREGGALGKMVPTFQAFMGGPLGDGNSGLVGFIEKTPLD